MATLGEILSSLVIGAGQSIRRNAGDTAFEAFTPGSGGGGGMTLVGSSLTEATTSSTTDSDLITISGLNITVGTPFKVLFSYRKTSGTISRFAIGFKVNSTTILPSNTINFTTGNNQAEDGQCTIEVNDRTSANYLHPGILRASIVLGSTGSVIELDSALTASGVAFPNATITSFTIFGKVLGAGMTGGVANARIWTYPTT
jgi:hypothetical protein